MKTTERHHLKDNELAIALQQAQTWATSNSRTLATTLGAIVIAGGAVLGYMAFRNNTDNKARALLAEAMVIEEARVMPAAPPAGTTNDPTATGGQAPGTYPTEQAKLEAALPKFQAAADAYPANEAGLMARFHAAKALVTLGRFDEAVKQYDQVLAGNVPLLARSARLGKAEAQIRAAQYDPAIATLKQIVDQKDASLPADAVLMELARAYRLAGKTDDARKTLQQVVEQHADSQYDPAIATLKQIVDQKDASLPADAVLMELARAYRLAGKTDDARKTLQQVVEQHADSQYATEAKAELEKIKS